MFRMYNASSFRACKSWSRVAIQLLKATKVQMCWTAHTLLHPERRNVNKGRLTKNTIYNDIYTDMIATNTRIHLMYISSSKTVLGL